MRVRTAVLLLLSMTVRLHAETGEAGWLRYAPLPLQVSLQYNTVPHYLVTTSHSPVAVSASTELSRGLRAMLGENLRVSDTVPHEDAFVLGTVAEIHHL